MVLSKEAILRRRPEDVNDDLVRHLKLLNLDRMFADSPDARVINNESLVSKKLSEDFTRAIYSNCEGELGFVPSCECGNVRGASKIGLICPDCGTKCSSKFIDTLSHVSWIGIPEHMPPVLHPVWYLVLDNLTTIGKSRMPVDDKEKDKKILANKKASLLDFVLNPELERDKDVKAEIPDDYLPYLKGRGWRYFYEHADEFLDDWIYNYPKTAKKPAAKDLIEFRKMYRDVMFTRKLPILHSSLHPVTTNGGTLNYVDSSSVAILSAAVNLSAEVFREHATTVSERKSYKALYDVYMEIMEYYSALIIRKIAKKEGILRKHNFGSRIHFSFRTVVHPHDRVLPMDEVILPWGIMVNGLKLPIINFLVNRYHKSPDVAYNIVMRSLTKYDELVDKCMQTFIDESKHKKIPIALGRNPTLNYGSIMLLYVKEYRKDPEDETLAINASIVGPANIGMSYSA